MRSSAVMAAGTLVSRVLGMVRSVLLAWAIGETLGGAADAFQIANTVPNSLYMLLAGGVLNAVLVPQIVRASLRPDGGREYVDRLVTVSLSLLTVVTVLVTAAAPLLVRLYSSSTWPRETLVLSVSFALVCLPQVFFYGLYTLLGQILNARGSFGPYMWAPVLNNVVAIAGLVSFVAVFGADDRRPADWSVQMILFLAGTATLGVASQAIVLVPVLRRIGFRWRPRWGFRGVGLGTASGIAGWTFAALLAGQLGYIVTSKVVTYAGVLAAAEDHVARGRFVYDEAFLLFMLPHSLVTVSLATAFFTRMAAAAARRRTDDLRADLSLSLRTTGVATVLSTAVFLALGTELAHSLFLGNSRSFTTGVALTAAAMAMGLVPFSAQYLMQRVFYSLEDARTPFWIQVVTVLVWTAGNLVSAAVLPGRLIIVGVGAAMSVANLVGAGLCLLLLHRRIGAVDGRRILAVHLRLVPAAVIAGTAAWGVSRLVLGILGEGRPGSATALACGLVVIVAGYVGLLRLFRVSELTDLVVPVLARLRRG
ncbi:MAG: murein biosynthesis integral membrane protein MurJ [Actinomycetales bacterium]|nr:murein biosynthesis integral membrane protein MurJ [Actinomycetales bacterium]